MVKSTVFLLTLTKLLFSIFLLNSASSKTLTLSTLNIRLYGIGGIQAGTFDDEFRDRFIKEFVNERLKTSDVIAFQEIMDVDRFKKSVMGKNYKCTSYKHRKPEHIHLVLCYKKKYNLLKENGDDNFLIDNVALKYLRPSVYGTLVDSSRKKIAHLVTVHLKAHPKGHEKRKKQMAIIKTRLEEINDNLPFIIFGDFNAYEDKQDIQMIEDKLSSLDIVHVESQNLLTYKTAYYAGTYDHFFISDSIDLLADLRVDGPCNFNQRDQMRFEDLFFYNQFVSDHCAVTISVDI